jgi:hypothetical protein
VVMPAALANELCRDCVEGAETCPRRLALRRAMRDAGVLEVVTKCPEFREWADDTADCND